MPLLTFSSDYHAKNFVTIKDATNPNRGEVSLSIPVDDSGADGINYVLYVACCFNNVRERMPVYFTFAQHVTFTKIMF